MRWFNRDDAHHGVPESTQRPASVRRPEPIRLTPLRDMPKPGSPAPLLAIKTYDEVPGFVYLLWRTPAGVLAAAYRVLDEHSGGHPIWVRELEPGVRCVIQVAEQGFRAPDGPDVLDQAIKDGDRRLMWRHYAHAIGQPAPYWPSDLNYRHLIEQWRPGHHTVTAVPRQNPDMTPLLELAALYEHDSPTQRVLMHYYYKGLRSACAGSTLMTEAFEDPEWIPHHQNLHEILVPAARAIDVPGVPDIDDLDDHALRAVFSGLVERRDTLAVRAVAALHAWGATKHMPHATYNRYQLEDMAMLAEWLHQLDQVPAYLPDPRFAGLLSHYHRTGKLFIDRVTGAPVAEQLGYDGEVEAYATLQPRRLPATTPLAELIIDGGGHHNWVRTADHTLYPAPQGDYDVSWGYGGSGYAPLVERLLDDINTPPIDRWIDPPGNGLTKLSRQAVPNGTVFTRDQLEQARRRPYNKYQH